MPLYRYIFWETVSIELLGVKLHSRTWRAWSQPPSRQTGSVMCIRLFLGCQPLYYNTGTFHGFGLGASVTKGESLFAPLQNCSWPLGSLIIACCGRCTPTPNPLPITWQWPQQSFPQQAMENCNPMHNRIHASYARLVLFRLFDTMCMSSHVLLVSAFLFFNCCMRVFFSLKFCAFFFFFVLSTKWPAAVEPRLGLGSRWTRPSSAPWHPGRS